MKSIVFVISSMNIGGVEKALLAVANKFIAEGWSVHVAMLYLTGGFMNYLPKCIKVHKIDGFESIKPILHNPPKKNIYIYIRLGKYLEAFRHLLYLINLKFTHSSIKLYLHEIRKMPEFSLQEFDLAVAFAGPDSFLDLYVTSKIRAKEKWGWIHFDVTRFGTDHGITLYCGEQYKRINVVSEEGKKIFDTEFPELSEKTHLEPNIIDENSVREMAKAHVEISRPAGKRVILTVGRVSVEKGQMMVLEAIKLLVGSGVKDIIYWMVGDGKDISRCKEYVHENGLEKFVLFLGAQVNPYPYMALCDLYVQPSYHEGFCITLAEVKLFGKEIIATNFTGAKEQLEDYSYPHKIVEISTDAIARAIYESL